MTIDSAQRRGMVSRMHFNGIDSGKYLNLALNLRNKEAEVESILKGIVGESRFAQQRTSHQTQNMHDKRRVVGILDERRHLQVKVGKDRKGHQPNARNRLHQ